MATLWELADVYLDGASDGDCVVIRTSKKRFEYGTMQEALEGLEDVPGMAALSGLLKVASGVPSAAAAGTDYVAVVSPPASASSPGVAGTIAFDGSYLYICTATNTWMRAAIATW